MNTEQQNTGLLPIKMFSSKETFDQYHTNWNLAHIETTEKPEPRIFKHYIKFDYPFSNVPIVQTGIAGFDIDNSDTSRLSIYADEITNDGFNINIHTWLHTRVYKVEISWIALGCA